MTEQEELKCHKCQGEDNAIYITLPVDHYCDDNEVRIHFREFPTCVNCRPERLKTGLRQLKSYSEKEVVEAWFGRYNQKLASTEEVGTMMTLMCARKGP